MLKTSFWIAAASIVIGTIGFFAWNEWNSSPTAPTDREEILFWHFWGGEDRSVVDQIVRRFNESQQRYRVRPIAMPGNNLDLKLFLAISGGDPPDLINHDDPIVADWAHRGAVTPLDELATPHELRELESWLFPAARRLGSYKGRMYALCNGLDIRALYYNRTMLDRHDLQPPNTIEDLDRIAETISPSGPASKPHECYGYLPDPRRLWAWGIVFNGRFYDETNGQVTLDDPAVVRALTWMQGYSRRYGEKEIAGFRVGDQSLPGKGFPLLAGRYAVVMDGQWRVRDIAAAGAEQQAAGDAVTKFGVCPLPPPPGGRSRAGWVNGNFFLVPRGAKNPSGSWQFMKFWSGFGGHEAEAAEICVQGGWIPASRRVVEQVAFQEYLQQQPLFKKFVELAASPEQFPTPAIPGAPFFYQEVNNAAATAMYKEDQSAEALLRDASDRIERHIQRASR